MILRQFTFKCSQGHRLLTKTLLDKDVSTMTTLDQFVPVTRNNFPDCFLVDISNWPNVRPHAEVLILYSAMYPIRVSWRILMNVQSAAVKLGALFGTLTISITTGHRLIRTRVSVWPVVKVQLLANIHLLILLKMGSRSFAISRNRP